MALFTEGKLFRKAGEGSGGGGGGDQHNLGWYATQSALETAHPTATAGDWAIVGSTDTVWIWDTDDSEWVDSDQKGQVTSVNNQTGAVTLTASDVGALPSNTHIPADQVNADWNANSGVAKILNKPTIPDPTQVSTLPTASADELGNIYQFVGTTDANYTNGYFYKCVSDGQQPATYSWTQVNVQPASTISTPATMPELTVAGWVNDVQTVNVVGVTTDNVIFVSPAPASVADYNAAGVVCTAQNNGTLTFTCTTTPSNAITVNVLIMG